MLIHSSSIPGSMAQMIGSADRPRNLRKGLGASSSGKMNSELRKMPSQVMRLYQRARRSYLSMYIEVSPEGISPISIGQKSELLHVFDDCLLVVAGKIGAVVMAAVA